jgi:hypothetical protein
MAAIIEDKMNIEDDEKLESLEFYIGLLKERVDNFKKEETKNKNSIREFISEYIELEDKIMDLLEKASQNPNLEEDYMDNIMNTVNTYLGDYQDQWESDFWDVYYTFRHTNDKDLLVHLDKKAITIDDASFLDDDSPSKIDRFAPDKEGRWNNNINNSSNDNQIKANLNGSFNNNSISKFKTLHPLHDLRVKSGSTNEDSLNMTSSHLFKIDEEMDKIEDTSTSAGSEKKEEKKRSCLDCVIY